jgi:NADH dehydrogenase FAD-containing subunit
MKKKIVVIGGGFAGIQFVKNIDGGPATFITES